MFYTESNQRVAGVFSILSAVLLIGSMVLYSGLGMRGVTGANIYEETVHAMAAHPIIIWASLIMGVFAMIVMFWTFEALDRRLRASAPSMSMIGTRFGNFHLFTFALYMLLPGAVLHDIVNQDTSTAKSIELIVPFMELSSVFYVISSIFFSLYLFHVGSVMLKSRSFSKALSIFSIVTGIIVLASGLLEFLLGRGTPAVIILSIVTFLTGFVIWKIWLGAELLRQAKAQVGTAENTVGA